MKKATLIFLSCISILTAVAQDTTKNNKVFHNEFGLDATGFIKQYINFNTSPYQTDYVPTYYLTYRRHFKRSNIRFSVGGSFMSYDLPPSPNDLNTYQYRQRSIALKLGYEFFSNLSKRWQVFYGIDFRPSWGYTKDDAPYWNGGYANGRELESKIYGVAPLLGFRFRINSRLSLLTEASFSINYYEDKGRYYYIPTSPAFAPIPDKEVPKSSRIYSTFAQPIAIIIAFDI